MALTVQIIKYIIESLGLYARMMRLHQRAGIWLLLLPSWWAIAMASQGAMPDIRLLGLFLVGAVAMRGAGCVINDLADRNIDKQVARTKDRPLASGEATTVHAISLIAVLLAVGLVVLLELNAYTQLLGVFFLFPVAVYPLAKRFMPWPQVFLGLVFNSGALIGWAAARSEIGTAAWLLYFAGFFWTLGYDTIYAHQDKKDDAKLGIGSMALALKGKSRVYISGFYCMVVLFLLLAGSVAGMRHAYYLSLIVALLHLLWQIKTVNFERPTDCMSKFRSNVTFGWIVFLGIVLDRWGIGQNLLSGILPG